MRIVKDAKERRNEILDVAERLFSEKGFDNTSTNDILKRNWNCKRNPVLSFQIQRRYP